MEIFKKEDLTPGMKSSWRAQKLKAVRFGQADIRDLEHRAVKKREGGRKGEHSKQWLYQTRMSSYEYFYEIIWYSFSDAETRIVYIWLWLPVELALYLGQKRNSKYIWNT